MAAVLPKKGVLHYIRWFSAPVIVTGSNISIPLFVLLVL